MSAEGQPPLCLFGAGGHGRVVGAIAVRIWSADVIFGDGALTLGSLVDGIPVGALDLSDLSDHHVIVTVGTTATRRKLQTRAQ